MTIVHNPTPPLFIGGPFHGTRREVPQETQRVECVAHDEHEDRYTLDAIARLGPRPPWWRPFARARWQGAQSELAMRPIHVEHYRLERWMQPDPRQPPSLPNSVWPSDLFGTCVVTRYFIHSSIPESRNEEVIRDVHPDTYQLLQQIENPGPREPRENKPDAHAG